MNLLKKRRTKWLDRIIILACFFMLLLPLPPWMGHVYMKAYDRLLFYDTFDIIFETMYVLQSMLGII